MKVTRKQVYRWFAAGKGFHTETLAYKHLAKLELGQIIHDKARRIAVERGCDPTWIETTKEDAVAAYAEMFPHAEDGSCAEYGKNRPLGLCATTINYPTGGVRFLYPWCKTKHRAWINAKIQELREADKK